VGFSNRTLLEKYRVLAYSRRNHYPNKWVGYPDDYSLKTERDDLVALLEKLHISKSPSHFVGSSYGAFLCLLVARDYPRLVSSLVLEEPPILSLLFAKEPEAYEASKLPYEDNVAKPLRNGGYVKALRYFVDSSEGTGAFNHLPKDVQSIMLDNARTLLVEDPKKERDHFSCTDAIEIKCPTLVVLGADSPWMFKVISKELEDCLPDCSSISIRDKSHSVHNQNQSEYNKAVLSFLSERCRCSEV